MMLAERAECQPDISLMRGHMQRFCKASERVKQDLSLIPGPRFLIPVQQKKPLFYELMLGLMNFGNAVDGADANR